jgi:hypothetical protein
VAFLAVSACLLPARHFSLVLTDDRPIEDLPVTFEDRTGLVEAVGPAQPGQFNLGQGVSPGEGPSELVISWVGGTCDHRTHLVLDARDGRYTVVETTDRASTCTLAGVVRTVTIALSSPLKAEDVAFESYSHAR